MRWTGFDVAYSFLYVLDAGAHRGVFSGCECRIFQWTRKLQPSLFEAFARRNLPKRNGALREGISGKCDRAIAGIVDYLFVVSLISDPVFSCLFDQLSFWSQHQSRTDPGKCVGTLAPHRVRNGSERQQKHPTIMRGKLGQNVGGMRQIVVPHEDIVIFSSANIAIRSGRKLWNLRFCLPAKR